MFSKFQQQAATPVLQQLSGHSEREGTGNQCGHQAGATKGCSPIDHCSVSFSGNFSSDIVNPNTLTRLSSWPIAVRATVPRDIREEMVKLCFCKDMEY